MNARLKYSLTIILCLWLTLVGLAILATWKDMLR